ncbi:TonB-dependent receptor [Compostibacter hankyongensis]|uniref:TonB-dependent receptor n=1 Tax=Compostibacter hankyongensis TaxID=1007089 RepID=A0ABP8G9L2_9BACT
MTVQVKGTSNGGTTDAQGRYKLSGVQPKDSLIFSFVGFQETTIGVNGLAEVNVKLRPDVSALNQVVVVGYGTQKKINLTGSVDVVPKDVLENRTPNNVADLLKGTSPNLNITMNMRGGEPGAVSSWNIRGMGSISGNASPLILVDGVEMDVTDIDPESVESISVLKDASASAIYGSRAPFGVILITTKKGSKGGVQIQYSNNLSWASPIKVPSYIDSYTWATAFNEANANAGLTPVYSDEQMGRIKGYLDGTFPYEYDPENPIDNIWAGRRNGNANNDWPQILIKNHSFSQKHNINVSGGNDKTQYYIGGSFIDQDGMYAYGYDYYKRYNFLTNLSSQVTSWLKFNSSVKYANGKTDFPLGETTVGREHQFREMIMFAPMMPFHNINGTIQSPLVRQMQGTGRDKTQKNDFLITAGAELEPVKGWKTNISYNYNYIGNRYATNPKPIWVELGTGEFGNVGKPETGYTSTFSESTYQLANIVSSYEFTLQNRHYFKLLLGYEQEEDYYSGLSATGTDLITEDIPSVSTALGDKTVDDQITHWATQGIFGRLNYNYKEKYLLEMSARYNGSSRFAKESRWGFFPSASVGYNLSSEEFWNSIQPYVNTFKLRASYGSLGNQNVSNYLYLPTIPVQNELNWIIDGERPAYASVPALISDDLTWETITTFNLGVDASFLDNRLMLTFDWYNRKTTDMLGPSLTLPYPLGAATPKSNNAEMKTIGFEILLSWEDRISNNLSYNLKLGVGDNKSTILKYQNDKGLVDTWYAGKPVGEIWGFATDGLIQQKGESMPDQSKYYKDWGPGDMKYKDLDGNGIINDGNRTLDNHGDLIVIGNDAPRYNLSFTAGLKWKNIDFNMFWQGVGKRNYYPDINSTVFWGMTSGWASSGLYKGAPSLDYWRPADEKNILGPNTDAYFARPYFTAEMNKNRQVQSRYVLNAAYLRLKNLQVGYTIPAKLLDRFFIDHIRVYFSGENLLLLSKLPKTLDPETAFASDPKYGGYLTSGVIYPISRTLSFGINLTF